MSQSISAAPPMHDIPLSGAEERGDAACEAHKANNSKANSLKRFFKLTHRRHNGGEEMPTGSCDVLPEDGGEPKDEVDKEEADKDGELDKPKREHARRFHLRLGGVTRIGVFLCYDYNNNMIMHSTNRLIFIIFDFHCAFSGTR